MKKTLFNLVTRRFRKSLGVLKSVQVPDILEHDISLAPYVFGGDQGFSITLYKGKNDSQRFVFMTSELMGPRFVLYWGNLHTDFRGEIPTKAQEETFERPTDLVARLNDVLKVFGVEREESHRAYKAQMEKERKAS